VYRIPKEKEVEKEGETVPKKRAREVRLTMA